MVGTGVKCKKCGSKFRVIFGSPPKDVSMVLGRDCGYSLDEGNEPSPNLTNVVCSKCGDKQFESLSLEEKIELQREWLGKLIVKTEKKTT